MMKRGEIVDDGSPETLLARYGRETLEDVFLDIARGRRQARDRSQDAREQDNARENEQGAER
jgi:ABC-2 type transport system ATP-binding protein